MYIYLQAAGSGGVLRCSFERFGKTAGRMLCLMVFILPMSHLQGRTPSWDPRGSLEFGQVLTEWYFAISHTFWQHVYIYVFIYIYIYM